jgi:cell division protein FtsB
MAITRSQRRRNNDATEETRQKNRSKSTVANKPEKEKVKAGTKSDSLLIRAKNMLHDVCLLHRNKEKEQKDIFAMIKSIDNLTKSLDNLRTPQEEKKQQVSYISKSNTNGVHD